MNNLISKILKNKIPCYFVSPHLDDAAFSAGELLIQLKGKVPITAINVFTSCGDGRNTLSAKQYLRQCQASDPHKLYDRRIREDAKALSTLGIKPVNLGLTEALWRKKKNANPSLIPELDSVYPTYRWHISKGVVSKYDKQLQIKLSREIKNIIGNKKRFYLFCPIGWGDHVDHILVRDVCSKTFGNNTIYWSDIPYRFQSISDNNPILDKDTTYSTLQVESNHKKLLAEYYQSQINTVIADKHQLYRSETYYHKNLVKIPTTKMYTSVSPSLHKQWKNLWERADNQNFYNSPEWFYASNNTFPPNDYIIAACYRQTRLVGLLPLVNREKGKPLYTGPGKQYADKSSLLLLNNHFAIVESIFSEILKKYDFRISELNEEVGRMLNIFPRVRATRSSTGLYLRFLQDPYRFMSSTTEKIIKKLVAKDYASELTSKIMLKNTSSLIPTMKLIEQHSSKPATFKAVFQNSEYTNFLLGIDKQASRHILVNLLYLQDKPIAYQFGFIAGKKLFWVQTAYDLKYRKYMPGKILMYLVLTQLAKIGIEFVDLSRGDGDYKRSFSPHTYDLYSATYTRSPLRKAIWEIHQNLRRFLESRPSLYEQVRISKNRFLSQVPKPAPLLPKYLLIIVPLLALTLTLRGQAGSPTAAELNTPAWKENGPFELSPERGRFALTYSLIEDRSTFFSLDLARFTTPDLGYHDGKYVSLFAPAVSYLTAIGYLVGDLFNASQVGSYAVIALFALLNALLIYRISLYLTGNKLAGVLGSYSFLFASPAYAYAVNLYQHHVSTFLILLSSYLVLTTPKWKSFFLIWLLCGISVTVDYPNVFIMLPVAIFATAKMFTFRQKSSRELSLGFRPILLLTFIGAVIPLLLFFSFNKTNYGSPFRLSGTVSSVGAITADGKPVQVSSLDPDAVQKEITANRQNSSVTGYFNTRNLLNGFYIHLLSPDRGMITFTPVILLGLFGAYLLYRSKPKAVVFLSSIGVAALLLYSLWGDPWGGWGFGSRYLIPAYAILAIFLAVYLDHYRRGFFALAAFLVLSGYSVFINTGGALATNAIPPKIQVLELEALSNQQERFSWDRPLTELREGSSNSFLYRQGLRGIMTSWQYFLLTFLVISSTTGVTTLALFIGSRRKHA